MLATSEASVPGRTQAPSIRACECEEQLTDQLLNVLLSGKLPVHLLEFGLRSLRTRCSRFEPFPGETSQASLPMKTTAWPVCQGGCDGP
jgi:hypothetical protein